MVLYSLKLMPIPSNATQSQMLVYKIAHPDLYEKSLQNCFNRLIFFILVPAAVWRPIVVAPPISPPIGSRVEAVAAAGRFITGP